MLLSLHPARWPGAVKAKGECDSWCPRVAASSRGSAGAPVEEVLPGRFELSESDVAMFAGWVGVVEPDGAEASAC
jgi:hypothetical protein